MRTLLTSFFREIPILAGLSLFLAFHSPALATDTSFHPATPFAIATVHFEHNATDGDAEVVFEVKGGDDGLTDLTVVSPNGHMLIHFTAPDTSALGIRQFRFESPEPKNIHSLKLAYPEGIYSFAGVTAAGEKLYSQSRLSFRLPSTPSVLRPGSHVEVILDEGMVISWKPVTNSAGWIIEIKANIADVHLTVKLPGSASAFVVPAGILMPGKQYELSLGTLTGKGNITFVESKFSIIDNE